MFTSKSDPKLISSDNRQSCISDHQCIFRQTFSFKSPYLVESANNSFIFSKHHGVDNFTILASLVNLYASLFKMSSGLCQHT